MNKKGKTLEHLAEGRRGECDSRGGRLSSHRLIGRSTHEGVGVTQDIYRHKGTELARKSFTPEGVEDEVRRSRAPEDMPRIEETN